MRTASSFPLQATDMGNDLPDPLPSARALERGHPSRPSRRHRGEESAVVVPVLLGAAQVGSQASFPFLAVAPGAMTLEYLFAFLLGLASARVRVLPLGRFGRPDTARLLRLDRFQFPPDLLEVGHD